MLGNLEKQEKKKRSISKMWLTFRDKLRRPIFNERNGKMVKFHRHLRADALQICLSLTRQKITPTMFFFSSSKYTLPSREKLGKMYQKNKISNWTFMHNKVFEIVLEENVWSKQYYKAVKSRLQLNAQSGGVLECFNFRKHGLLNMHTTALFV